VRPQRGHAEIGLRLLDLTGHETIYPGPHSPKGATS
jgi:hypothetical protein